MCMCLTSWEHTECALLIAFLHSSSLIQAFPILKVFDFLQNAKLGSHSYQLVVIGSVTKKNRTDMTCGKFKPRQLRDFSEFQCTFISGCWYYNVWAFGCLQKIKSKYFCLGFAVFIDISFFKLQFLLA